MIIAPASSTQKDPPMSYLFETLQSLDWEVIKNGSNYELERVLHKFVVADPLVPVNSSCKVPDLSKPTCAEYPLVFSGSLEKSLKIGHIIQFGADVDVLEILLNEMDEFVDKFFLLESTVSHSEFQKKPLFFEAVKYNDRFAKFKDKIVHIILDEIDVISNSKNEGIWSVENLQERERWNKFLAWNNKYSFFSDEDLIGFGDADQIASRYALNYLKNCKLKEEVVSVDVGITYFEGTTERIIKTDWPLAGYSYAVGDPGFYTFGKAKGVTLPTRQRGKSSHFILGGAHLTWYSYFPFLLLKRAICTECKEVNLNLGTQNITKLYQQLESQEFFLSNISSWDFQSKTWYKPEDIYNDIKAHYYIPWYLECNKLRFPGLYGELDPRVFLPKSDFLGK